MPTNTRLFKCLCSISQIAMMAILVLGQAPQSSLAFAPSRISPAPVTSSASRRHLARHSAIPATASTASPSFQTSRASTTSLRMSESEQKESSLPVFLDPGTKGGAVVLSLILFVVPILVYYVSTGVFGADEFETQRNIGIGFTVLTTIVWGASYIFRVATKDMTYAKQLKDYEDAVIAKRLEELDEDEVQALVEDIERDAF